MYLPKSISPIIKVSESCNYSCEFCHYAQNKQDTFMDLTLCREIMEKAIIYNKEAKNRNIQFIFHGGEPTLCQIDYFKEILEIQSFLKKQYGPFNIVNLLQTNGSLVDDDWIEFFKEYDFRVGFSIDGGPTLNYHYEEDVNASLDNYRKGKQVINLGLLSVVTDKHITHENEFYDFCIKNEIQHIGLCYCYNEETGHTVQNQCLSEFLINLFDLYFYSEYRIDIREFNNAIEKLLGKGSRLCTMGERQQCGTFLTFDTQGRIFFCDTAYDKNSTIGNIQGNNLHDILLTARYQKTKHDCMEHIINCKKSCNLFTICGGGCYRHDQWVHGQIYNKFCDCYKLLYQHISDVVKPLLNNIY